MYEVWYINYAEKRCYCVQTDIPTAQQAVNIAKQVGGDNYPIEISPDGRRIVIG